MVNQIDIYATPDEMTTNGFMKIKEWGQEINLRFLMDPEFRGKLTAVVWNTPDNKKKRITADDEEWSYFSQVGERPEIDVPSTWLDTLGLSGTVQLRIKFEFDTFRHDPSWYAYLYIKEPYGDLNPPYKAPKPQTST